MVLTVERKRKKSRYSELVSSRAALYKTYKLMCKLLGCEAICYGPLTKKMATEGKKVIYALCLGGEKLAVAELVEDKKNKIPSIFAPGGVARALVLRKSKSQDLQKRVVLRILKALEDHDVTLIARGYSKILKRGIDFESLLLMEDLVR